MSTTEIGTVRNALVKPSSIAGNGLLADRDIAEAETAISLARPFVTVLDTLRLDDTCSHCFAFVGRWSAQDVPEISLKACAACRIVKYCSKTCQARSWKRSHKWECKKLQTEASVFGSDGVPHLVRAAIQAEVLMDHDTVDEKEKVAVGQLVGHRDACERQLTQVIGPITSDAFQRIAKSMASGERGDLYAKIMTNSLTLVTPAFDPLGLAFDPVLSSANHSCEPNAVVVFDGPRVSIRTLTAIPRDGEIFLSYVDNSNPFRIRQAELKERYNFTCKCSKCQRGYGQKEDTFTKSAAQMDPVFRNLHKGYNEHLRFVDDPKYKIGTSDPESQLAGLQALLFEMMKKKEYQAVFEMCLRSEMWPVSRQPFVAARNEMFADSCTTGLPARAVVHGVIRYLDIDPVLYPQEFHPVRVVHLWALLKALIWLCSHPEHPAVKRLSSLGYEFSTPVWRLARRARTLVLKSHGSGSLALEIEEKYRELEYTYNMSRARTASGKGRNRPSYDESDDIPDRTVFGAWLEYNTV